MKRFFQAGIGLTAATLSTLTAATRPTEEKPNVVIFFLDDSGYGDYTHTGNPTISTPNITKMTQEGVNFTQFHVTTAACSASRYSLITGRYPSRSGLGSWVIGPGSKRHIHAKENTIAEGLKSRGYATGLFGKWHLGSPNKGNGMSQDTLPLAHGFDEWIGTNVSHDYGNAMLLKSDPNGTAPIKGYKTLAKNLPSNTKVSESLTGACSKATIDFIKKNKNKPFFAYVPFNMPHLGLYASDKFKGVSRRGLLGDCMAEIDDAVGRIRQTIKDAGIEKNTILIFSSDNGPWILFNNTKKHGKYGEARMHVGYAMPFRDGKGSTWEGGHRVPGIICWPGQIEGNRVVQEPASTLDILPTIFKLTGVEQPTDRKIDGRDIRSLLFPNEGYPKLDPFTFFYHYSDNRPSAVRIGPWKMHIRIGSQTGNNYGFKATRQKPLLFQVEQDISERIDRTKEQPELIKSLTKTLNEFEAESKATGTFWDKK